MKTGEYIVREAIEIPYFDHDDKSLKNTIRNSSKRRGMNPIRFALRKIRNIILNQWSYSCPLNGPRVRWNRRRGVSIGENVYIGQHCTIDNAYPEYVYIEDNVSLAGNVTILAHSNPYPHLRAVTESGVSPVIIKEGAWIADGVIILRGVTIGENAIIAAGTVVDKDVPDCSLAKGNPMKIVANFENLIE
ncbi:MAG: acyltransferase [Paludibacteraceae bacterium]|nr:acyltransferase [Paludibacteraceae bacterium]